MGLSSHLTGGNSMTLRPLTTAWRLIVYHTSGYYGSYTTTESVENSGLYKSVLADRTQKVTGDGVASWPIHVKNGVPKRRVLGLVLFLVFVMTSLLVSDPVPDYSRMCVWYSERYDQTMAARFYKMTYKNCETGRTKMWDVLSSGEM